MSEIIKFDDILNNINNTETIEWNGYTISIKRTLSLREVMEFVDNVVDTCFSSDEGIYTPEVLDFAIRYNVLVKYAGIELPDDAFKGYDICCQTDLYDEILRHIDYNQFISMEDAIDKNIEYRTNENVAAATRQMNEAYSAFKGLEDKLLELFGNIDKDSISKLVSALSENGFGFDEEKLVKAVIDNKE